MSAPLEPIQVEIADVWHWQRESWALFIRRPLMFSALSFSYFFIANKLPISNWLAFIASLVICQVFLALAVVLARGADNSYPFSIRACYRALKNSVLVIVLFSLLYAAIWFIAALFASFMVLDVPHNDYTENAGFALLEWLSAGTISFFVTYCCIMVAGLWFLMPLAVFHKLGIKEGVQLAKYAEHKNLKVIITASYLPFSFFFVLFLMSELVLAAAFLAVPLTGIYWYVSYRHVFLGNRENSPAAMRNVASQPA